MLEHYGTHLMPPGIFRRVRRRWTNPVKQLFGPTVVLDVRSRERARMRIYQLGAARVEEWEKRHGRIPEVGAIVLLRRDGRRAAGCAEVPESGCEGEDAFFRGSRRRRRSCDERKVSGLGCDTLSIDHGASSDYAVLTWR